MPTPMSTVHSSALGDGGHRHAEPNRLRWIDAFEIGCEEIDALHRKLVQDCNSVLLLLETEADWSRIVADTRKLVDDCIAHFHAEEDVLARTRFPRIDAHEAEHRKLAHELRALVARMERVDGSRPEHREYPKLLGPSLVELIIRHDLDFKSHLSSVRNPAG